jgi:imidazolonepropionase-like amidohydrolase
LIDPHVHLALDPTLEAEQTIELVQEAPEAELIAMMQRHAHEAFLSGVTTVRDCGSPRTTGVEFRRFSGANGAAVPRVLVSGRPITTSLGHCHWMGIHANSSDELLAAVAELSEEGVDFVKVMATGGMMTSSSNPYAAQYSQTQLSVLVGEARRRSLRVAAHALSAAGVRAAVAAQVDTLEHCVTTTAAKQDFDARVGPDIAAAGIVVGLTAHKPLRDLLRVGDMDGIRRRLAPHRKLLGAGVDLIVHSDAGTPGTLFSRFAESIEIFRIGLMTSVGAAISAATTGAATALGIEHDTGQLSAGYAADFVIVDDLVSADIRAVRNVVQVARDGILTSVERSTTNH